MREVEAYRRFKHPNIIKILDSAAIQDEGGDGKIIYLWVPCECLRPRAEGGCDRFLPFYSKGNLQDAMTSAAVTGNKIPERRLLEIFKGTCLA